MITQEAVDRFLKSCQDRGLSPSTIQAYNYRLRHLPLEIPELPTTTSKIEAYLRARGETPSKRGKVFDVLQGFFTYLEKQDGTPSPVPPKGPMGRPPKKHRVIHDLLTSDRDEIRPSKLRQGGSGSISTSLSTAEAVSKFLTQRRNQGISPAREAKYHSIFKPFIARFPELPTSPEPIEEFIHSIKGEPETRFSYQSIINALYNFLEQRYKVPNPTKLIKPFKVPRKVRKTLELDQLQQLLSLDLSPQDSALLILIMDTGLRQGEICTLCRENVHNDFISVNGKTGERQVPISPITYQKLAGLVASGPLFLTERGPISPSYLYHHIQDLLGQIGVTTGRRGTHILRHSYARHYMAGGGDLMSLKEVLGHTRVSTTQIYAQLAFSDVKQRHGQATPLRTLVLNHEGEPPRRQDPAVPSFVETAPGEEEPLAEEGAVQIPMIIPEEGTIPTPPYIIREYVYSVGGQVFRGVAWRIIGSNGAWWQDAGGPHNFLSFEEAQSKLKQLSEGAK